LVAPRSERPVSTLHDYLDVLRRRKWIVVLVLTCVPVVAVLISMRQPAVYQASAEVLVSRQTLATQLFNLSDPAALDAGRIAKTQARLARSPDIARRTLDALGLGDRDASELLGASTVTPAEETDILVFSVRDDDPDLAARLASEYASQFAAYRRDLDVGALANAREQVEERIEALEAEGAEGSVVYRSLVDTRQQLEAMEALQSGRATVVRSASSGAQIEPQPRRAGMVGLALGLVLAVTLAFLREALDSRARTSGAVIERLQLPLLARVPGRSRREVRRRPVVMLAAPNGRHAEPFRVLRTKLEFANLDRAGARIMVTSAEAKEGKSTTVANLAVALARAGRRVLLVDMDLRSPALHKLFELGDRPGVTDVVLGTVELDEALAPVSISPFGADISSNGFARLAGDGLLEVLSAGTHPSNPAEMISLVARTDMLEVLSGRADIVLLDAPPLLSASETLALTARVNALILIARAHAVRVQTLDEVRDILDACPTVKLGLVLTRADESDVYYPGHHRSGAMPGLSLGLGAPNVEAESERRTSPTRQP
jgi:Mrp family chromosome partitioning ATPase/capsular polysaccharide biosynthesis protein